MEINIPVEQYEKLRRAGEKLGLSVEDCIQRGIDLVLACHGLGPVATVCAHVRAAPRCWLSSTRKPRRGIRPS